MKHGYQLTFYTLLNRHYQGQRLLDRIKQEAQSLHIEGLTVRAGSEGMGHDGRWHEIGFVDLSDQPIEVVMILSEEQCTALLHAVRGSGIFYTRCPIDYDVA